MYADIFLFYVGKYAEKSYVLRHIDMIKNNMRLNVDGHKWNHNILL